MAQKKKKCRWIVGTPESARSAPNKIKANGYYTETPSATCQNSSSPSVTTRAAGEGTGNAPSDTAGGNANGYHPWKGPGSIWQTHTR